MFFREIREIKREEKGLNGFDPDKRITPKNTPTKEDLDKLSYQAWNLFNPDARLV